MDRELNELEENIIMHLKEQEEKIEESLIAVVQKKELKVLVKN